MAPAARPVARRLGIVDRPHARKILRETIPSTVGVFSVAGMFFGLAAGMAAFAWLAPARVIAAKPLGRSRPARRWSARGLWDDCGMKLPKLT
jgi:hypothetical protein